MAILNCLPRRNTANIYFFCIDHNTLKQHELEKNADCILKKITGNNQALTSVHCLQVCCLSTLQTEHSVHYFWGNFSLLIPSFLGHLLFLRWVCSRVLLMASKEELWWLPFTPNMLYLRSRANCTRVCKGGHNYQKEKVTTPKYLKHPHRKSMLCCDQICECPQMEATIPIKFFWCLHKFIFSYIIFPLAL